MTTRMHLTQAELDLIVELCIAAALHKKGEHEAACETYEKFSADDWERVTSIIYKLDQPKEDDVLPWEGPPRF